MSENYCIIKKLIFYIILLTLLFYFLSKPLNQVLKLH